jgi:hypothetical protein
MMSEDPSGIFMFSKDRQAEKSIQDGKQIGSIYVLDLFFFFFPEAEER